MILDTLFRTFGAVAQAVARTWDGKHPGDPALARMLGIGGRTSAGVRVNADSVLGLASYWRAINILSNTLGKLPANVYQRTGEEDGRERDRSHPADAFLRRRPGRGLKPFRWKSTMQSHALRFGNGFTYVFRDEAARPVRGVILDPSRTVVHKTIEELEGIPVGTKIFLTNIRGQDRYLLEENVIHIHGLGYDGLCGYPLVEILAEVFGLGLAAQQFGARFFGKGANASGFLKHPGQLDAEVAGRLKASFDAKAEGLGKSHEVILLEEGMDFIPNTIAPEEAQFLGTREFSVREIANVVGIQSHKLGDQSRKSYASLEQSQQEHLDDDVDPWLVQWEEELGEKLLTEKQLRDDTHYVEFERKALLKMDAAGRSALYASGRNWGIYSINDICRRENMPTIGPLGDMRLVPANMIPLDQATQVFEAQAGSRGGSARRRAKPAKAHADATSPAGRSAASPASEPTNGEDPRFLALVQHNLAAIRKRIETAAAAKRKKSPEEYSAWLAGLDENEGPPELHQYSVPLMKSLKESLK